MTPSRFEPIPNETLAERRPSRQFFLRYALLTVGVFVPLIWAFLTNTEWYPVSDFKMFYGASALNKGEGFSYFVFRGETIAGETVDIAPIKIMNGMDDRIWTMVNSVVANESLKLRWPHPGNQKLVAAAGNEANLPRAVLLPDLLRVWGNRYNAKLSPDSPHRLVRVRLDEYRWPEKEYGNYFEFIESWRVDL